MLNPMLYAAMCQQFGAAHVRIVSEDDPGDFRYKTETVSDKRRSIQVSKLILDDGANPGERYVSNCPFCGDSRGRLFINHRFAVRDARSHERPLWMSKCFNENCLSDFDNRQKLANMLTKGAELAVTGTPKVRVQRPVELPGAIWPLADMVNRTADHPALIFLETRGFNPRELAKQYGLVYCVDSPSAMMPLTNRIVMPVYGADKKLVTWTARRLRDTDPGPKWYHCPHAGTATRVFGLEYCAGSRVICIVEGPIDQWAVPRNSGCVFGKVVSPQKIASFVSFAEACDGVLVNLLDPRQNIKDKQRGAEHHCDVLVRNLRRATKVPILDCRLPWHSDPGSLDEDVIWRVICETADRQCKAVKSLCREAMSIALRRRAGLG